MPGSAYTVTTTACAPGEPANADAAATTVGGTVPATLALTLGPPATFGAFTLPQPLQVDILPASWAGPVSHATSTITFTQPIAANDPLRTGTYNRTLTFTLSTTNP